MSSLVLYDAFELIILCGIVNMMLNIFWATKRKYDAERFDVPFDFGLHIGSWRILGVSTTWGGLVLSILLGLLIQKTYSDVGLVIGLGCFFGHALGSFVKRRLHIPSGAYLPVVDHGDYVIFTGAILLAMAKLSAPAYLLSIALVLAIHPLFCIAGYRLGIRANKF